MENEKSTNLVPLYTPLITIHNLCIYIYMAKLENGLKISFMIFWNLEGAFFRQKDITFHS